ncbi:MAG: hypothetical protein ACRDZX_09225 [Acidimicrobiales bacterium]
MEWLLLLLIFLLLPVVLLTSAAFAATASLRRANRVAPDRGAGAPPLLWLWSPGAAATLHRRLRYACQLVGPVVGTRQRSLRPSTLRPRLWRGRCQTEGAGTDEIAELAGEVLREAVSLDHQVVSANLLGRGMARSQALGSLGWEVSAVEDAARRVHRLATRRAQLAWPQSCGPLTLDERIAAMEAALSELTPRPPSTWAGPPPA